MSLADTVPLCCLALAIEAVTGYPPMLYRLIGHPVTWMGVWLGWLEGRLNVPARSAAARRAGGVLALVLLFGATAGVTVPLDVLLGRSMPGWILLGILAASLPAQRSLGTHVRAVAEALDREGLTAGRRAVSMIVGRDTEVLDEAGICRAAIESLAENFSDGIVAPALFLALFGLAGGALYKAANTADSMIGHRNTRYAAFGWAAARFDDLVNLPASRLAAFWIVAAASFTGNSAAGALRAVGRDARHHRSPNAGWPEAAVAGALGLALAGPRLYGGEPVEDSRMGDGRRDASPADIRRALQLYRAACALQLAVLGAIAIAMRVFV